MNARDLGPSALAIDPRAFVREHPLDGESLAINGFARSGKTAAIVARARRASAEYSGGPATIVGAVDARATERLRLALADARGLEVATLEDVAFTLLRASAETRGVAAPQRIDDVHAAALFEPIGATLFSLEWDEFVTGTLDPEITGLRAPERFAAAAFRLILKLRAGAISPDEFKRANATGATKFYAHPPNFANPDLIMETPAKYRDSLRATPGELARQHAREIDLGKILAKLYETYLATLRERDLLTGADALLEAATVLERDPAARAIAHERWRGALIDDAQDLTSAHLAFVVALFGAGRRGVTFAGDARATTTSFSGARGEAAFKDFAHVVTLASPSESPIGIARAAALGAGSAGASAVFASASNDGSVEFYRGSDKRDEAAWVAARAASLVANGVAPAAIAIITRSLPCASVYVDALLARNVNVDLGGRANPYDVPAAADALATLWAIADPYRHDWLLRVLESPSVALSDASLAMLCAEPATPQTLLFELPEDAEADDVRGRWDRRRDLRLARNVTRGDTDADLPDDARERLIALRAKLRRYETLERELDLPDFAHLVLDELALGSSPASARARYDNGFIERVNDDVATFAARRPFATLHDYLLEVERACEFDADLLSIERRDSGAVAVFDVEAAKGLHFAHVFVVDVRAGAFPQWYVPDAFLFSPTYGMIAKENVGDASAARTAKFSFVSFRMKLREKFIAQERRAFATAASRATQHLYVSASGRATKGAAAPEILAELQTFS